MKKTTIGYDARIPSYQGPFTVDPVFWDSVLHVPDGEYVGPTHKLFTSLTALEARLAAVAAGNCSIIAVTEVRLREEMEAHTPADEQLPRNLRDWEFLGYDVADWFLLDGIHNFDTPADKLNRYGLFSQADVAERRAIWLDSLVVEHSPFYVYGLFRKVYH